jgi:hypothetical protein
MGIGGFMPEKITRKDLLFLAQNHGTLNNILEFPDIAAPLMRFEFFQGRRCELSCFAPESLSEFLDEIAGNQSDIVTAFPQRRYLDGKDMDPAIEIISKFLFFHHFSQIQEWIKTFKPLHYGPIGGGSQGIRQSGLPTDPRIVGLPYAAFGDEVFHSETDGFRITRMNRVIPQLLSCSSSSVSMPPAR